MKWFFEDWMKKTSAEVRAARPTRAEIRVQVKNECDVDRSVTWSSLTELKRTCHIEDEHWSRTNSKEFGREKVSCLYHHVGSNGRISSLWRKFISLKNFSIGLPSFLHRKMKRVNNFLLVFAIWCNWKRKIISDWSISVEKIIAWVTKRSTTKHPHRSNV